MVDMPSKWADTLKSTAASAGFALLVIALMLAPLVAHSAPSMVIVVRHAERDVGPAGDPGLSPAGERRAKQLADALSGARIESIITTHYRRTRDTARPLAQRLGIEPAVIAMRPGEGEAHVPEVIAAIRALSGRVLVVGHSNTINAIVSGLGGPDLPTLCETTYSRAFVVVPAGENSAVAMLHYGDSDPPGSHDCLD